MPVPTVITDLSQTAASNYPAGSDSPATLDDTQRAHGAFIAQLRDGKGLANSVTLASATTTDIGGQNSQFVEISGTTTITSLGSTYNGPRFLRFTGILTLTYNASTLTLPTAASITTAAGDAAIAVPNAALNGWTVVAYQRANGNPLSITGSVAASGENNDITSLTALTAGGLPDNSVLTADIADGAVTPAKLSQPFTLGTPVTTTGGVAVDITGIPSWVSEVTVFGTGVSTNGSSGLIVQGRAAGVPETSGYVSNLDNNTTPSLVTTGFGLFETLTSGNTYMFDLTLKRYNATNTWLAVGVCGDTGGAQTIRRSIGTKTLAGVLDGIRITTVGGANTFDVMSVNVNYK